MVRQEPASVELRNVTQADLPIFFEQMVNPEANFMAAFTAEDPADKTAFAAHWSKLLADDTIINRTILFDGQIAGHIASFVRFGDPEITYWLGKEYWGKGVATLALAKFLAELKARPLYARAAKDNLASIRVLEKCGFVVFGYDKGFANARATEIEEVILKLK